MVTRGKKAHLCALVTVFAACGGDDMGPHVRMDFSRKTSVYDAPVPADDLTGVDWIPNPGNVTLLEQARTLLKDADGFATTGGVFFAISEAIDPATLPTVEGSVGADASAFIVGIDPASPDFGMRYPLEASFSETSSQYGAPNLVTLLPIQGIPLLPGARYAAVLTTAVRTVDGKPLARAEADVPDGVTATDIAGLTTFTTGHPTATLAKVRAAALARALPAPDAAFALTDTFTDYCAFHTTIGMPDYQAGVPPFTSEGGAWQFDATGAPILQRMESANLVVTIPKSAMPAAGYPLIVFVRTGGGGDRPLVDRGQQAVEGGASIEPGEGPARYFARAGFAAIEVDGPLGGLRNPNNGDEQFATFNVANLPAMRDNIRESAVELDVLAHVAIGLHVDTSGCGGTASASFDAAHVGIMGHSMGSWIEPLAVAEEPLFRAVMMSGAGGSWIENILYKQKPTPVYTAVSTFLRDNALDAFDPVITYAQWALEGADPQVYGRGVQGRHVLMMQGIVDDYILPRIANSTSLSIGLDLAGAELDTEADPRLADELALGPLLPLIPGTPHGPAALPAHPKNGVTAVVTQHHEDGIEDGHEVMFQTDAPKHEYQCFLASWLATGNPVVPSAASRDAACP